MSKTNSTQDYFAKRDERIVEYRKDGKLMDASRTFLTEVSRMNYSFNFSWLGRPIIQIPQDLVLIQEIIWSVKPDFIIETGIAHGGSLIFYASMMELLGKGKVIGIDIDIREHNRKEIESHPMMKRIEMVEGSSISKEVADKVKAIVGNSRNVIVSLDSNHTHDHVLKELELYTPYVSKGGYCIVFDTGIEDLPAGTITDRPWDKGNNPKTAIWEFLKKNNRFIVDKDMDTRILVSAAPEGYLKCIKD